ncbi:MAG: hypothetical protein JWO89_2855, partial [Verrucomicrobiaceae bacterium]|nr:hypothetical protein [Verrucomicrobiaceae bacterium]
HRKLKFCLSGQSLLRCLHHPLSLSHDPNQRWLGISLLQKAILLQAWETIHSCLTLYHRQRPSPSLRLLNQRHPIFLRRSHRPRQPACRLHQRLFSHPLLKLHVLLCQRLLLPAKRLQLRSAA